jgi:hypothetical protein
MSQESKYRKFSEELRESALRHLAAMANVPEFCRELGSSRQRPGTGLREDCRQTCLRDFTPAITETGSDPQKNQPRGVIPNKASIYHTGV